MQTPMEQQGQPPKLAIIPIELAQAIFNYLNTQPHGQVRQLIDGLTAIRPYDAPVDMKPGTDNVPN